MITHLATFDVVGVAILHKVYTKYFDDYYFIRECKKDKWDMKNMVGEKGFEASTPWSQINI